MRGTPASAGAPTRISCRKRTQTRRSSASRPATSNRVDVTPLQLLAIAWLTRRYFERHQWPITDTYRIVGHSSEAWKRGRKTDPEGGDRENPILSPEDIRQLLVRVQAAG